MGGKRGPLALERELERRRIADATALFVAGDPLAIDVPIAFMAAKRTEARNLRLLGEAAARDIDPEIIRHELLWTRARMSRLLVLTTRELAAGYRLAGVTVFEVASSAEAATHSRSSSTRRTASSPCTLRSSTSSRDRFAGDSTLASPARGATTGGHDGRPGRRPQDAAASDAPSGRRLRDHVR